MAVAQLAATLRLVSPARAAGQFRRRPAGYGRQVRSVSVRLHGGPLDGEVRQATADHNGTPPDHTEFEYDDMGTWYVEYRCDRQDQDGWHFQATGIQQRADED